MLKKKQIRFQTPYPAKMKIHWEKKKRDNATEAAEDMRARGYPVDPPRTTEADWERRLTQGIHWSRMARDLPRQVRGRLSEFQQ